MKNVVIASAFALAGFAGGTIASLYVSNRLTAGIEQETFVHRMLRFNAEAQVAFAQMNIRNAEKGDTDRIIRTNCQIARSAVPLIEPRIYDNSKKRAEVEAAVSRATDTILALEASGKCGRP